MALLLVLPVLATFSYFLLFENKDTRVLITDKKITETQKRRFVLVLDWRCFISTARSFRIFLFFLLKS